MWKEWKWDSRKMDVCGEQAELCCRSGGGQRWGAAWWDNEQHLSPIKSLYLSPSSCTVTTCRHCFAIWWLHLSLYRLHVVKIVFYCSPLVCRCRRASAGPTVWKNFSLCDRSRLQDEQSLCFRVYCSDFVSEWLYHPFSSACCWMN